MVHIDNVRAERERVLWQLEQLKMQPETIHKQNKINELLYNLNELDKLIDKYNKLNQARMQTWHNQYAQQPYYQQPGYVYNTSNYPNYPMQSPYQTQVIGSPYASAQVEQPRPVLSTNNSAAHRYAKKELPPQFKNAKVINNEPAGSYVVKAEPPKQVKRYTKDSKYPILCDISRKEIEIQLETGYIQREVEFNKENGFYDITIGGINTLNCVKTKQPIKSFDDFFNTFKDKIVFDIHKSTYQLFSYTRVQTFILPYQKDGKLNINDYKKIQNELTEENVFDKLRLLHNGFNNLDKFLDKRYTNLFNGLVKYSYMFDLECDSFLQDAIDLKSEISKIKLVKDIDKYKEILNTLVNDFKSIAIELMDDGKYIKVQFKDPELLTNCPMVYEALSKQKDITCLRSNSYEILYQSFIELFKFYGENTKTVKFVTVNDHMEMRKYTVYSCGAGVETQFIIVRDK